MKSKTMFSYDTSNSQLFIKFTCFVSLLILLNVVSLGQGLSFSFIRLHHQRTTARKRGVVRAIASTEITTTDDPINGDYNALPKLEFLNLTINKTNILPEAPPLTYDKFLTMQEKRVVVTIRYSGESGLRPYFLTLAKKLKASHPDVIIERRILPFDDDPTFEILVDGTVVVGKTRARKFKKARVDMSRARSVFVSMQELDIAISRARRRRRPSTVYGDEESAASLRKATLRKGGGEDSEEISASN